MTLGDSLCPGSRYTHGRCQRIARRHDLQRLFSTFPSGWPGAGLLLLRAAVGLTAIIQGSSYLTAGDAAAPATWLGGGLAVAGGAALLIGLFTPLAGTLVGLINAGVALRWIPAPAPNLFDARLSLLFVIVMAVTIILLGPGAFSLDARLFGRREIIIPHASRSPKS